MPPLVQFVTTSDGVRVAYRQIGAGHPLIYVRGWVSHLDYLGQEPRSRAFFEALATARAVVQYDTRGNGLSDRRVSRITLEQLVLDLEAVTDCLRLEQFDLYGQCFGGPIAISYATKHPGRVSSLVLDGTYARGRDITTLERKDALLAGIRAFWPISSKMLDHLTVPDPEANTSLVASQPDAISGPVAAELYELAFCLDVTNLLPEIKTPTLVIHRRGSQAIPFRLGRELAISIPGAQFVPLEGTSHNPWGGDTAALLRVVGDFVGEKFELKQPSASAGLSPGSVTILFTDIVGSTALTRRLGDEGARTVLREHERIVREALAAHGGSEIKSTGDGFMASFGSARKALECAIRVQRAFADENGLEESRDGAPLKVRIGLNAGEPVAEGGDLFGTAVNLAARIADKAEGGEILVSNVVRELTAGKGFGFSDRGDQVLRGFEDPIRVYAVKWREGES